ncbi:ribonuclease H-like domain-containing protein [Tanacetum coccineum]|uniref:Ribonuclease H-like domain-containing protein n=1 Tax=Tanacetum coccineum TaxID=301880 RepID=A0ABQ5F015_9ASTR
MKLMQILMGLNDVFQPIRSSLLSRETLLDVKDTFAIVSREKSHRGIASSSVGSSSKPQVSSFVAKSNNLNNNGNKKIDNNKKFESSVNPSNNRGSNPNLLCKNYGKVGHTTDKCFDLIGPIWQIIDSGANQNMTISTLNMFRIIDIFDLNLTVGHPNGTLAKIKYVGNLKLSENVVLFDVLVVPEYSVGLLYVNKLIKDSIMFIGFTETRCYIQDLHLNKIVGTGSENGGLYMFDTPSSFSSTCQTLGNLSGVCFVSKSLWHTSLGHPSDQAVDMLHHALNFTKDSQVSPCDICHKAKQTREPFHFSDHQTTSIGEFIHLLPSFVLDGKYPFELVYGFKPKLSHLRSFGCLCFSSILNNSDKFSASPNDEGRGFVTPTDDGNVHPCIRNSDVSEDDFATFIGDNSSYEGNVPSSSDPIAQRNLPENTGQVQLDVRRSSRFVKMPAKFNDYVVNSSRKYGLEKYVTYSNLNTSNYYFFTNLNKSSEPTSYYESIRNLNWVEAMNNEIEALKTPGLFVIFLMEGRLLGLNGCGKLSINQQGKLTDIKPGWLKQAPMQWNAKLTKALIEHRFQIKDLGKLKYFLGIEVSDNKDGICLSQRKYCLELLHEYGLLAAKHVDTPLPENTTLNYVETDDDNLLVNVGNYQRLVAKHVDTPLPENTTLNYVETDDDHLLVNVENYQRLVEKPSKVRYNSAWLSIVSEFHKLQNLDINLLSFMKKRVGNGVDTAFWEDQWLGDEYFKTRFHRVYALESDKKISVAAKMSHHDLGFSLRRSPRDGVEQEQFSLLKSSIEGVVMPDIKDRWIWSLTGAGDFSVASANDLRLPSSPYKTIWLKVVPKKINVLAWKVRFDFLPTRLNLSRRGVDLHYILCLNCNVEVESTSHVFFACSMMKDLYRKIFTWWDLSHSEFSSYDDWFELLQSIRMHSKLKDLLEGFFYVVWWLVWNFRNQSLFDSRYPFKAIIFDVLVSCSFYWCRSSVEAEYRSMASATCEVIWLSNLLGDMGVKGLLLVVMEKVATGVIKTEKIHTSQQIADVLTKALDIEQHKTLCVKLGMLDMFKVEKLEGGC